MQGAACCAGCTRSFTIVGAPMKDAYFAASRALMRAYQGQLEETQRWDREEGPKGEFPHCVHTACTRPLKTQMPLFGEGTCLVCQTRQMPKPCQIRQVSISLGDI